MKTTKFSYDVHSISNGVCQKVANFPTLAMARQYCIFNRGHYRIVCFGVIEYKDGIEVNK